MNNNQDFGFNSTEFLGEITTVPYCQFINSSNSKYGIAITSNNAEIANVKSTDGWQSIDHEFSDGTEDTLLITDKPKILVINRSQPMLSNDVETIPYSKDKFNTGNYKAFSYLVVWFLDDNNQPISELPFRLKCSGYAGLTFLKNYSYYNNPDSFCKKFLAAYKILTNDRAVDKNDVFYAHAIYQPTLVRKKATSSQNGQSSFAVMTDSFIEPTVNNFASLIIKNGSSVSNKIKEFMQSTQSWLKDNLAVPTSQESKPDSDEEDSDGIESLTPEPIAF